MNIAEQIRFRVVIARLDTLQREYDRAMQRLAAERNLVNWIDWEMSALWIEKAALERQGGYPREQLFT